MPIVEPFAIGNHFPGGKVNMNYQIIPFTYITRTPHPGGAGSELVAESTAFPQPPFNRARPTAPPSTKERPFSNHPPPAAPGATDPQRLPLNLNETDEHTAISGEVLAMARYSNPLRRFAIYTLSLKDTLDFRRAGR